MNGALSGSDLEQIDLPAVLAHVSDWNEELAATPELLRYLDDTETERATPNAPKMRGPKP